MLVFFLTLAFVYAAAAFARQMTAAPGIGPVPNRPNWIPVFFAGATLVLVSGLRSNIGDTYFYMYSYAQTDFTWDTVRTQKDIGFNLFQMLLQRISGDPQFMIFTVALLTNGLIVWVLYRYSRIIDLSLYVYVTSGMYLVSMNGIRQYLAAAMLFAATKFILEGSWKKYAAVVAVASLFHSTALILFPIYFVVRKRAWSWTTLGLLTATFMIVIGFNEFFSVLFTVLENTQYGNYNDMEFEGANAVRVAVHAVPLALAFVGRNRLREMVPYSDYFVNMSLLGFAFLLISTQNWIFARFSIYFGLYNLILISWVVYLFVKKQRNLVYYSVLVCYGVFFLYEQTVSLRIVYRSAFLGL